MPRFRAVRFPFLFLFFDRFTAIDQRLQEQRHAFHIGDNPPRIARYLARHPAAR